MVFLFLLSFFLLAFPLSFLPHIIIDPFLLNLPPRVCLILLTSFAYAESDSGPENTMLLDSTENLVGLNLPRPENRNFLWNL